MKGKLCKGPIESIRSLRISVPESQWKLKSSDIGDIEIGAELDIYDPLEAKWFPGCVIDSEFPGSRFKIAYYGWSSKWDEWIYISSGRLKPLHTHTTTDSRHWEEKDISRKRIKRRKQVFKDKQTKLMIDQHFVSNVSGFTELKEMDVRHQQKIDIYCDKIKKWYKGSVISIGKVGYG